ncbi:hypothetical protein AVEN_109374-1 [Araneus ventricosus]|uniref:Uncharacterized protein n=1 Tax=Araneus ventricosus TaxID=182803 RepID=A0A4Y2J542_ARAVE|nr:hypothetical protein AVEN_109374-1 [Araneus ventricosus]
MAAGTVQILRIPSFPPNPSERAALKKKALAAGVKSMTLNDGRWRFDSDIRTFRTGTVFCLKGRFGRSGIDRVKILLVWPFAELLKFNEAFQCKKFLHPWYIYWHLGTFSFKRFSQLVSCSWF